MNIPSRLQSYPCWARLGAGGAVAALLGAAVATWNGTAFGWLAAQSPLPKHHADTGNRLAFWWEATYFLGVFFVPTVLAHVVAGRGWRGWLGVAAYVVLWWQVSTAVASGPGATRLQAWSVVFLGLFELLVLGLGMTIGSNGVPYVAGGAW